MRPLVAPLEAPLPRGHQASSQLKCVLPWTTHLAGAAAGRSNLLMPLYSRTVGVRGPASASSRAAGGAPPVVALPAAGAHISKRVEGGSSDMDMEIWMEDENGRRGGEVGISSAWPARANTSPATRMSSGGRP